MKRLIEVTQKHIDEGKRGEANTCAVALALTDATGYSASVGTFSGTLFKIDRLSGVVADFDLPKPVTKWIKAFDSGSTVTPMSFEIDLPDQEVSS